MSKRTVAVIILIVAVASVALAGGPDPSTSFFVTSVGNGAAGGDYGGLAGADQRCLDLATTAGLPAHNWAAYLSTAFGSQVDARDRIGPGPWFNYLGTLIANDVGGLHANGIPAADVLDEFGNPVPSLEHDILTGSGADGTFQIPDAFAAGGFLIATCGDFSSSSVLDFGGVGHADGGGAGDSVSESWNSAHLSECSQAGLAATLGSGRIYCFATDAASMEVVFADGFEEPPTPK